MVCLLTMYGKRVIVVNVVNDYYLIMELIMINLVSGRAYRVYTRSTDKTIAGTDLIISDEKIVIFENGVLFVMNRNRSERMFFETLEEYQTEHQEIAPVVGICDLHYDEPFAFSTLLIHLSDNPYDYYRFEFFSIVSKLRDLFYKGN